MRIYQILFLACCIWTIKATPTTTNSHSHPQCNYRGQYYNNHCHCNPPYTGSNCELFNNPFIFVDESLDIDEPIYRIRMPDYTPKGARMSNRECRIIINALNTITPVFTCIERGAQLYYPDYNYDNSLDTITQLNNYLTKVNSPKILPIQQATDFVVLNKKITSIRYPTLDQCTSIVQLFNLNIDYPPFACESSPCLNNATCINIGLHNYTCVCAGGWRGEICHFPDVCHQYCNSHNSIKCTNVQNTPKCHCKVGYYGKTCQCANIDRITRVKCGRVKCSKGLRPVWYDLEPLTKCYDVCQCE